MTVAAGCIRHSHLVRDLSHLETAASTELCAALQFRLISLSLSDGRAEQLLLSALLGQISKPLAVHTVLSILHVKEVVQPLELELGVSLLFLHW